jgi:hypothetical protein
MGDAGSWPLPQVLSNGPEFMIAKVGWQSTATGVHFFIDLDFPKK